MRIGESVEYILKAVLADIGLLGIEFGVGYADVIMQIAVLMEIDERNEFSNSDSKPLLATKTLYSQ